MGHDRLEADKLALYKGWEKSFGIAKYL